MKKFISIFIIIMAMAGCGDKPQQKKKPNYEIEGPIIIIPQNSNIRSKIKTIKIVKESFSQTIQSPATIEGNPTKMAKITPPLAGKILKIHVQVGQFVNAGDSLFSMNSPDFVDAQKNFLTAKQQLLQSETNYNRQKDLSANGVGVQKDLEEALRDVNIKKGEFENAIARLKLYGINYETMKIGNPLVIKAPVSGYVSGIEMTIGQFKNDLSEVVMVVADLSEVWITANVKEKDIRFLHPGDYATAQVAAYPGKVYPGKILFADDILNSETHSLKVRIQMPNPDKELKPGMFASITFIEKPVPAILIPGKALLQKEDKSFVFVQLSPDKYEKRIVETSETTNGKILVLAGLKEGEVIVSEGGFYLLEAR
jgi:cobalt-zinc-cadmium efflux system membrane fusion protein